MTNWCRSRYCLSFINMNLKVGIKCGDFFLYFFYRQRLVFAYLIMKSVLNIINCLLFQLSSVFYWGRAWMINLTTKMTTSEISLIVFYYNKIFTIYFYTWTCKCNKYRINIQSNNLIARLSFTFIAKGLGHKF